MSSSGGEVCPAFFVETALPSPLSAVKNADRESTNKPVSISNSSMERSSVSLESSTDDSSECNGIGAVSSLAGGGSGEKQSQISGKTPMDFCFLRVIGEGAFSTVYLAKEVHNSKQDYAIKVLTKSEVRREGKIRLVLREKDILVSISYAFGGHPFIVKIFYAFQDAERLYFAVSYAKNGELLEILKRLGSFDEPSTLFYASEILCALDFLHNRCRIIHRDLKPENILVSADWHIILSDFGSAKTIAGCNKCTRGSPSKSNSEPYSPTKKLGQSKSPSISVGKQRDARCSFVGTAHYISPEVLKSEKVGPECDYWALGAIIFQMISGQPPFRAVNEYKVMKKILDLQFDFPDGFPDVAKDLVSRLLVNDPIERLGSYETGGIDVIKAHVFFKNVDDWESLPNQKPPQLKPYLPASSGEPAFYSDLSAAQAGASVGGSSSDEELEPGYEAAQLRLMGFSGGKKGFGEFSPEHYQQQRHSQSSGGESSSMDDPKSMETVLLQRRLEQLNKQRREHKFHRFVNDNLILKCGLIDKKKGLFARRRMFLLTEGPHLFYVDPTTMVLKGEIKFSTEMRTEAKNFRTFFIHTPKRTYYLFDPERHAKEWCDAVDWVKTQYLLKQQQPTGTDECSSKT